MLDTPILRAANDSDVRGLLDLYGHLVPDQGPADLPKAQARLRDLTLWPGSEILVAELGERVVATVTLIVVPNMTRGGAPYAFIENVVTDALYRRRGLATALLADAEARAWARGCYRIMIVSGDHNTQAHQVYRRAGFKGSKIGFQKRKVPDRPVD